MKTRSTKQLSAADIEGNTSALSALLTEKLGKHWVVGAPLGLGKPHRLLNGIYRLAKEDSSISLAIATALSLSAPGKGSGLQARFMKPFVDRHFGTESDPDAFVALDYVQDISRGNVPDNIRISEFYMQSGSRLGNSYAQRHYLSSNYTHVARDIFFRGANVIVQLVAVDPERPEHVSLAGNPDVTLDLMDRLDVSGRDYVLLAEVHDDLPYMAGDAEVPVEKFDAVLEAGGGRLYAVPRMPVPGVEHRIGLYASTLIRDGGTLQLGIGALGDAVCHYIRMRHAEPAAYARELESADAETRVPENLRQEWGGTDAFEKGLFGASEMFMDGFLHLYEAGILCREVYDHPALQRLINDGRMDTDLQAEDMQVLWQAGVIPRHLDDESLRQLQGLGVLNTDVSLSDSSILCGPTVIPNDLSDAENRRKLASDGLGDQLQGGAVLHAAFFLGSAWFYQTLRELPAEQRQKFQMTRVSRVNELYGGEELDRAQRQEARFINTCMKVTLLGSAVSDQLKDGQVVSGVGGQYNFVAMAHALPRGRSILMLRSTHGRGSDLQSNIVWEYPHSTIPRHLRDIVITEYGVADLRGKTDEEVIQAMISLADSRFQDELLESAKDAGKLCADWQLPEVYRRNLPEMLEQAQTPPAFPFGSDFTDTEQTLIRALEYLRDTGATLQGKIRLFLGALSAGGGASSFPEALERMDLNRPASLSAWWQRRLLLQGLKNNKYN